GGARPGSPTAHTRTTKASPTVCGMLSAMTDHPDRDDEANLYERGTAKIREVYAGAVVDMPEGTMPFYDVMMTTLFAQVWDRAVLPIRDRRLLLMGVIAAQGSVDTWKIQARAALDRGELDPDQLRE